MEELRIVGIQSIVEQIDDKELTKTIVLEEDASLDLIFVIRRSHVTIDVITQGKNSKANISCIFLSKKGEKVTATVKGKLQADHSSIQMYLLSLLGDQADCQIDGGIDIAPDVVKTAGHLLEENIILGKKVKIKTLPMLDVRSSDVSASHGAKIDRLDENKLFYMMAKGIDQKQAQKLIVSGYIENIFNSQFTDHKAQGNTDDINSFSLEKVVAEIMSYFDM